MSDKNTPKGGLKSQKPESEEASPPLDKVPEVEEFPRGRGKLVLTTSVACSVQGARQKQCVVRRKGVSAIVPSPTRHRVLRFDRATSHIGIPLSPIEKVSQSCTKGGVSRVSL
jgi:hypothetical protein